MKQFLNRALIGIIALFAASAAHAETYSEGFEYNKIPAQSTQSGDKIEVIEFFWYGCPHCFKFEPHIQAWLKNKADDVNFIRIPAVLNPNWAIHAKAYYTLELMGKAEELHGKLFDAIHRDKRQLFDRDSIADFVAANGVDRKRFLSTMRSFAVEGKMAQSIQAAKNYQISGVPTLIVNGKYVTDARRAGGNGSIIKVIDFLIEKERQAR